MGIHPRKEKGMKRHPSLAPKFAVLLRLLYKRELTKCNGFTAHAAATAAAVQNVKKRSGAAPGGGDDGGRGEKGTLGLEENQIK